MASNYGEDISNNLNDIRKELRIANQLKFLELSQRYLADGECDIRNGYTEQEMMVLLNLRNLLTPIEERA
jgi:hypothetical protein